VILVTLLEGPGLLLWWIFSGRPAGASSPELYEAAALDGSEGWPAAHGTIPPCPLLRAPYLTLVMVDLLPLPGHQGVREVFR